MKLIYPILALLIPLQAPAAVVTWQFTTVVDASPLGGLVETPLKVTYSYDDSLPEGFGSSNASSASYGPATMHITLGAETIIATGAAINLWDNTNNSLLGFPPQSDGYSGNANGTVFTGHLLGLDVDGFAFHIYDTDLTMFTGKPGLPVTPDAGARFAHGCVGLHSDGRGRVIQSAPPSPVRPR